MRFEDVGVYMDQVNEEAMLLEADMLEQGFYVGGPNGSSSLQYGWLHFYYDPGASETWDGETGEARGWSPFYKGNRSLMARIWNANTLLGAVAAFEKRLVYFWDLFKTEGGKPSGRRPTQGWEIPKEHYEHEPADYYLKLAVGVGAGLAALVLLSKIR